MQPTCVLSAVSSGERECLARGGGEKPRAERGAGLGVHLGDDSQDPGVRLEG